MAKLEEVVVGAKLAGINNCATVEVVAVKWYGSNAVEVVFKENSGEVKTQLLYRDDETALSIIQGETRWNFSANSDDFRLLSEALRIQLASLFDPYLAVRASNVEPLPHQISAVYEEMLPRMPLKFVLADDPGAGKTIMTGLFIKELIVRGDLKRCLIVSPGSLSEQWQDELFTKFRLRFEILTNDRVEASGVGNVFSDMEFCIARLDKLARDVRLQTMLKETQWDLVVVDEAHKMSASVWGGETRYTKRYQLGKMLAENTRHFLLLTATPHNGKDVEFQKFMALVDPDRFEAAHSRDNLPIDVSDVMRRLVKEELLTFDGKPLFPERRAYAVKYDLSPQEETLYADVTEYVKKEFDRADKLDNKQRSNVGFALAILQRRLASSPEAIYQSLRRRRERLEKKLQEKRLARRGLLEELLPNGDDFDEDDLTGRELEETEELLADQATAATNLSELEVEIESLRELEITARDALATGKDRKWEELSRLLQDDVNLFCGEGKHEKLIIFTEHRDTLNYLARKIRALVGTEESVVTIYGAMSREDRRRAEESFRQDPEVRFLIATDAAGEGVNLQRAHLMVNYDLPWNPNRLEQRFGRIHRIGQREVCHLWNLVAHQTREGMVFTRLFEKLDEEKNALGGKVFDVLGKATFDNKPLSELLIEAVRYGSDPKVRAKLLQTVDSALDRGKLRTLLEERAFAEGVMDVSRVVKIRQDMERAEARRLQPHFIEAFFIEAFRRLGGKISRREGRRYEIAYVPSAVRDAFHVPRYNEPILDRYERVCFEKSECNVTDKPDATLLAPGHALLEATIVAVKKRFESLLEQGAIFINETDPSTQPRLLCYLQNAVQNGRGATVLKRLRFIEMRLDGTAQDGGYAPYLDYRSPTEEELVALKTAFGAKPLFDVSVEDFAFQYAVSTLVPKDLRFIKDARLPRLTRIAQEVNSRLTSEMLYWDKRALELKKKEEQGKQGAKLNFTGARKRAEELESRLNIRLAEIEKEKRFSALPPQLLGAALIVPQGALDLALGKRAKNVEQSNRSEVENAAMRATIAIERSLGFVPRDVSEQKCGYDVESSVPGGRLRMIEVKGRQRDATTVTVTKNEILTAFNKEDDLILALVEVDGEQTNTTYLKRPFRSTPEFATTSVTYNIQDLINQSEIERVVRSHEVL